MERPSRLRHLACLLLSLSPLGQAAEAPIDCAALDTKAAASLKLGDHLGGNQEPDDAPEQ